MSDLRALAGGVVACGFEGIDLDREFAQELRSLRLAGVVLFARNVKSIEQLAALTQDLRACFEDEPIIGIDQEGGRVARICEGVVEIPSMMAVGAVGDAAMARNAGRQIAHDLRRCGINVNFAPVLDLALERKNTVIGTRAFSSDPHVVSKLAAALAQGLEDGGIVPTFKHFPGYGSTDIDGHVALPVVEADARTLRERDLLPFAEVLPGATAVMTAHVVMRAFDAQVPATLSHTLLTDLLRKEMHFEGVCFTDCMQMDAIAKGAGSAAGAVRAVAAGADCVLISQSSKVAAEAIDGIVRAVEVGSLSQNRLHEANARVRRLRATLRGPIPLDDSAPYPEIGRELGVAAVTIVRGTPRRDAARSCVITFQGSTVEGVQGLHAQHASLTEFVTLAKEVELPLDPHDQDVACARGAAAQFGQNTVVLMRRAHIYLSQRAAVEEILRVAPGCVLVSAREPFDCEEFEAANMVLTFGDDAPNLFGLAQALFKGVPARRAV